MLSKKIQSCSNILFKSLNQSPLYTIIERKYTPLHEWIDIDYEEKVGRIGITNLGLKIIGKIALTEMMPVGTILEKDSSFATVMGQHYTAELVTPVKTEIIGYNKIWLNMPSLASLDVEHEDQWFVEINLSEQTQLEKVENLLTKEHYEKRYEQFIGDGIPRLYDVEQQKYE